MLSAARRFPKPIAARLADERAPPGIEERVSRAEVRRGCAAHVDQPIKIDARAKTVHPWRSFIDVIDAKMLFRLALIGQARMS